MPNYSWTLAAAGLLLCACSSALSAGSNTRFTVDAFGTDRGLPSSAVLAVTQTRDGYLWVGTLEGLARFDGVQFTVFDENNTPELNSRVVRRLFEDRQTNLWVGTENGGINLVKAGKWIGLINLLIIIFIQEFTGIVTAEPKGHLGQIIGAEGEEFSLFGDLVSG